VIDKKSEHWEEQPWWFRTWALGLGSRKAQIWLELVVLVFAVIASIMSYFDPVYTKDALFLMYILYVHTAHIRYGDKNQSWGYAT
jgi:hypothetical protein